ncbi:ScbR family autoregulator-binding transcription factor [Lentzea flava]|uniref:ScbR family autoregulator-binding transcription factor n=1 Tax=Lentzea flava TaxID=103732 RepID=UPI001670932E|nr:ScbR family autoregulator-binding transcription factor [Lentzea flava]MCP2199009.1 transcriptional regulator, TetR family [Lentzea flava]
MRQQRAEQTRARLVEVAAELFDRYGFAGTNISDITAAAGVTKGALYFHFTAKEELVEAVQDTSTALLADAVAKIAASGVSPLEALIDLSHAVARMLVTEPAVRASFRIARECGDRAKPFVDFHHAWWSVVRELLRAAKRNGQLVTASDVSLPLLAMYVGIEALWSSGMSKDDVSDLFSDAWRLLLPGLVPAELVDELLAE